MFKRTYTVDDVALVPQFNNIPSRAIPCLDPWLTRNRKVSIPLLVAHMDTMIREDLAHVLIKQGAYPISKKVDSEHKNRLTLEFMFGSFQIK